MPSHNTDFVTQKAFFLWKNWVKNVLIFYGLNLNLLLYRIVSKQVSSFSFLNLNPKHIFFLRRNFEFSSFITLVKY